MSRPENKDSASVKQQTLDILTHSLKKTHQLTRQLLQF